jgi:ribA/ribD-fused uncharacterized protein
MDDVKNAALPTRIDYFKYEWGFLSNFYPAEVYIWVDAAGVTYAHEIPNPASIEVYASTEHAYQAFKALKAEDRWIFQVTNNPNLKAYEAKSLGAKLKTQGKERPDWRDINIDVMRDLLRQKFHGGITKRKLLSTFGAYLEEGNYWHDEFWGVCHGKMDGRTCRHGEHEPSGENWLGYLLMEVRSEISGVANPFPKP